jgi:hypothetical protein
MNQGTRQVGVHGWRSRGIDECVGGMSVYAQMTQWVKSSTALTVNNMTDAPMFMVFSGKRVNER